MAFGVSKLTHADVQRVVEAHYDDVYAYCRRHLPTSEEAQDVTQEVFLRFVRSADRYRDAGKPLAYLLTIARNACIDAARARSRQFAPLPDDDVLSAESLSIYPGEACGADELDGREALRRALATLPLDAQELLELRYDQELSYAEIARVLGISRFSVKRRMDAALAELGRKMEAGRGERP